MGVNYSSEKFPEAPHNIEGEKNLTDIENIHTNVQNFANKIVRTYLWTGTCAANNLSQATMCKNASKGPLAAKASYVSWRLTVRGISVRREKSSPSIQIPFYMGKLWCLNQPKEISDMLYGSDYIGWQRED